MGQKVNPHGLRVGIIKDWDSKWYAEGEFSDFLVEDYDIRKFLKKKLYSAGVSKIEIERAAAIVAIRATKGMIVITRKKASWPGNILISGIISNLNIFNIKSLAFFMISPFIYNLLY